MFWTKHIAGVLLIACRFSLTSARSNWNRHNVTLCSQNSPISTAEANSLLVKDTPASNKNTVTHQHAEMLPVTTAKPNHLENVRKLVDDVLKNAGASFTLVTYDKWSSLMK